MIIIILKHISYSSLIKNLNLFNLNIKISKKILHILEENCKVINCYKISNEDNNEQNIKYIKIEKSNDYGKYPNIFNLIIPVKSSNKKNTESLILTVRFKQDYVYLDSYDIFNNKLKRLVNKNNKKLLIEYSKIIAIYCIIFSNKYGLNIERYLNKFYKLKNKKNIDNLKNDEDYFLIEYIKLFYLDNQIDKSIELYKILIKNSNKEYIKLLLPLNIYDDINNKLGCFIIPKNVQEKIDEKEEECSKSPDYKPKKWLDSIKKIPFGNYKKDEVFSFIDNFISKYGKDYNWNNFLDIYKNINKCNNKNIIEEWNKYIENRNKKLDYIKNKMDESVYGHTEVKNEIIQLSSEWMNGNIKGQCIGIHGPPGNGKTSISKNGICNAFLDENNDPFPYVYISLGAANNGSYLFGHHYTFQGSTYGQIAEGLMKAKCMNPIFYFDELDKISQTESGKEIINTLIHITDFTQNDNFEDIYFSGIKLDLSKCLFIFSFNNINNIDRVLRDRLHIIHTNPLTLTEKVVIGEKYLLKNICSDIGWNIEEIKFKKNVLEYIIKNYTFEAGVRKLKTLLKKIIRYYNHSINFGKQKLPLNITTKNIDKILDVNNKMITRLTHTEPQIGLVNGLYCIPDYGIGGSLPIQAKKTIPKSDKQAEFNITGNLGKVMKESVECAKTTIWKILNDDQKNILKEGLSIHLHALDGATPKEGPSAGAAITLCLYSIILNKKIRNNIALTGEITLDGKVTAIGGVAEKVNGGHSIGCNIILIPEENRKDFNIALKNKCFNKKIIILKEDELADKTNDNNFYVKFVKNINQVIDIAII